MNSCLLPLSVVSQGARGIPRRSADGRAPYGVSSITFYALEWQSGRRIATPSPADVQTMENIVVYIIGCLLLVQLWSSMASSHHHLDVAEVVSHVREVRVHALDQLL